MFSGQSLDLKGGDVDSEQEIVDLAVGAAVNDPDEHVDEITLPDHVRTNCSAPWTMVSPDQLHRDDVMPAADLEKRRAFAHAYATSGNATAAARSAGVAEGSAHSMGYKWLRAPEVLAAIREEQDQFLKGMTGAALQVIRQVLNDAGAPAQVRLAAAREVLDRAGFAKPKRQDVAPVRQAKSLDKMSRAELEALIAAELDIEVAEVDAYIDGVMPN